MDTNLRVSAYTARGISADLVRFILAEHDLLTGEVNLTELRRVLGDRFRATATQVKRIEGELRAKTIVPKPATPAPVPRSDPDDQWVLASAIAGEADLLVTGDKHLLDVAAEAPVPIVCTSGRTAPSSGKPDPPRVLEDASRRQGRRGRAGP